MLADAAGMDDGEAFWNALIEESGGVISPDEVASRTTLRRSSSDMPSRKRTMTRPGVKRRPELPVRS